MAKMEYIAPIEAMRGKITEGFGAARYAKANANGERYNWAVRYGKRDLKAHPYTEDETAAKTQFKAVQALVAARQTNAQKRVQDQAAFEAQTAKKTLKEYLWSICKAEYLASLSED